MEEEKDKDNQKVGNSKNKKRGVGIRNRKHCNRNEECL